MFLYRTPARIIFDVSMQYLAMNPVPTILSFLSPSVESSQLRSKAVYALSGLCKHNAAAVKMLDEFGGWEVLRSALEGENVSFMRGVYR
jgi:hypothetical protein